MLKHLCLIALLLALAHSKNADPCPNDIYCTICDKSKCKRCHSTHYPDSSGICQAVTKKIEKCAVYLADGTCEFCDFTYNVSDNKCVKIPVEGCDFANNSNECWVCSNGVAVQDGNCKNQDTKCVVENCKTCLGSAVACFECAEGYANFNLQCVEFENCHTVYTTDKDYCVECAEPTYNSEGSCKGHSSLIGIVSIFISCFIMLK